MPDLVIRNLRASIDGAEILKGIDLELSKGEIHAIMGPNGSGKSTLAHVLMGHPAYEVTGGEVTFKGADVLELEPDERSRLGMFLAQRVSGECRKHGILPMTSRGRAAASPRWPGSWQVRSRQRPSRIPRQSAPRAFRAGWTWRWIATMSSASLALG